MSRSIFMVGKDKNSTIKTVPCRFRLAANWQPWPILTSLLAMKAQTPCLCTCPVNLLDYLEAFDYIRRSLQTKEARRLLLHDNGQASCLENVVYIKGPLCAELSMDQGLTVPETIDAVCEGLRQPRIWHCCKSLGLWPTVRSELTSR